VVYLVLIGDFRKTSKHARHIYLLSVLFSKQVSYRPSFQLKLYISFYYFVLLFLSTAISVGG